MLMIRRTLGFCFLMALVAGLSTGCGVIYSTQTYGASRVQRVTKGASKADVFANLGTPNSIYRNENGEVFCYKYQQGTNILGLYAKISRTDTIIVMDNDGMVQFAGEVPIGEGMTILSGPFSDATHPVRTDELLFDPENYDLETSIEPKD